MKVRVEQRDGGAVDGVYLVSPGEAGYYHARELRDGDGAPLSNKLIVDRAGLETATVDRDGQAALCHWPGYGFYETRPHLYSNWKSLKPHSAHCPLAEAP